MTGTQSRELRRRSLVKSLLWRVIGVVWTWVGAYIILLFVPPSQRSAAFIATLIVVYHHSTRMVMYYAYERAWASVAWGRDAPARPMSRREKILWSVATAVALLLIFLLLLEVHPRVKPKASANTAVKAGVAVAPSSDRWAPCRGPAARR